MSESTETKTTGSSMSSLYLVAGLLLTGVVLYALRAGGDRPKPEGPPIGSPLAVVNLRPLTGDPPPIGNDELRGKVTLINLWGTWCPPCRREFPHLAELSQTLAEESDFQLLAVSCGMTTEDFDVLREETETFVESQPIKIPTYYDPGFQTRRSLAIAGGEDAMSSYPTTLLLDRQGIIRGFWQGYEDGTELEMLKQAEKLLKAPPAEKK